MNFPTKNSILIIISLFLCASVTNAQQAWINAGNDTTICSGPITLKATVNDTMPGTGMYQVDSIAYNPYPFTGGTQVTNFVDDNNSPNKDDGTSGPLPIGFNFCFFGNSYNQFYVNTNGWISFSANEPATYVSTPLPDSLAIIPKNCIMGPYLDWDATFGGVISYQTIGTAPFRKLIVTFDSLPTYNCVNLNGTFQIVLNESYNTIENYIGNKPICGNESAVQGIQNATGTLAYTVPGRNNTQWTANQDAFRYTPVGPAVSYTINWLDSGNVVGTGSTAIVNPTSNTSYVAQLQFDCSGISYTDTVNITTGIIYLQTNSTPASCYEGTDGTASVSVIGGGTYNYTWSNGGSTSNIGNLPAGTYSVTVSNNICTATDSVTIGQATPIQTQTIAVTDTCGRDHGQAGVSVSGGTPPYSFSWTPTDDSTVTIANLAAGNYYVTVTDTNGCQHTDTAVVDNIPSPTAAFSVSPQSTATGYPIQFTDQSNGYGVNFSSWEWNLGDTIIHRQNTVHTYTEQGTYNITLIVTNAYGCRDSITQQILIENGVNIPNIIIPNEAGPNNVFTIKNLDKYPGSALTIFDRWGRIIYHSNDYQNDWHAEHVAEGTYYYNLRLAGGKQYQGFLTVLKKK